MSHRSNPIRKLKQTLKQTPATHAAPKDAPRPLRVVPPSGNMPVRPRPLAGGHAETQVMDAVIDADAKIGIYHHLPRTSPTDLPAVHPYTPVPLPSGHMAPQRPMDATQILPVVAPARPVMDATGTQVLPRAVALPPSARHVDPRAGWSRVHVEDNDLEPDSRGRHVLNDLKSESDDVIALVAVQQRAHAVLDVYDPMRRAEVAAQANDERMRAFAAKNDAWGSRYEREFESWAKWFKKALAETRNAWAVTSGRTNAARLEMDYNAGGTSAALYTKDQLAQEIARRDAAGSAVAQ